MTHPQKILQSPSNGPTGFKFQDGDPGVRRFAATAIIGLTCLFLASGQTQTMAADPQSPVPTPDKQSASKKELYLPSLQHNPKVPAPPAAAVRDFNKFLKRLAEASERSIDSLVLDGDALDRAEEVLLNSNGVPEDIPIERHLPFIAVNPEAIFGLYHDLPTLERGLGLYQQNCSQCHGAYGRGNGAATSQWYLGNYPRNFSYGKYKSRSTDYGTTPTDSDLFRTLTRGLYGSTMPSFRHLSVRDRWALVQFLKTLANIYDDYDEVVVNRFDPEGDQAPAELDMSGEPPVSIASVTRGRDLFAKHGCVTCHQGNKAKPTGLGRSDGTFSNWADEMNRPISSSRDLTTPVFLAGSSPSDLFRIIAGGPNIGPMPNYQTLPREDCWALVHYIQSGFKPDFPQPPSTVEVKADSEASE